MQNKCNKAALSIAVCLLGVWSTIAIAQTTVAGTTPGQFSVNESGAATYSIPIQVPPGVAGMQPQLSLEYNSQSGNGLLGMGWNLSGLSAITRCPRTMALDGVRGGVNYDMNDRFCLDGQRLILVSGTYGAANSEYRTERESFSKIVAYGNAGNGPAYFTMQTKAGLTMELGNTTDSRIEAQGKTTVRVWAINRVQDVKSNFMTFSYVEDGVNGDYYPTRVDYAGNVNAGQAPASSVRFILEARQDMELGYLGGSTVSTSSRIVFLKSFNGESLNKEYRVGYEQGAATTRSRIKTITECDGSGACLSPTSLNLSDGAPATLTYAGMFSPYSQWNSPAVGDFNADGKADMLINTTGTAQGAGWHIYLSNGDGTFRFGSSLTPYAAWTAPQIADFNGDGRDDVLINTTGTGQGAGWHVYLSNGDGTFRLGSSFTPYAEWSTPRIADFNADGKADILINTTGTGQGAGWHVYMSNGDGTFRFGSSLTPYAAWTTPQVTDFDGDGRADVLINTTGNGQGAGWHVYMSNGDGTFRFGSSLTPYAAWTTPQVADFNGDGKADVLINTTGTGPDAGWHVYLSKGDGSFRFGSSLTPYAAWTTPYFADFNGDGKADVLINTTGTGQGAGWHIYLSNGNGFFRYGSSPTPYAAWGSPIVSDFTGDGRSDVIIETAGSGWFTYLAPNGLPDLLLSVGAGSINNAIDHKPLTASTVYTKDTAPNASVYPKIDLQYPQYVVSTVSTSNGLGGVNIVQYSYGGLKAEQGTGRGSLGFRWMKSKSVANNIESYTEFNQNHPFTGTVAKNETRLSGSGNAGLLKRTTNTYAQSPGSAGASVFVYPSQSLEESWDLSGTPYPGSSTSYVYGQNPQYGDPTQITVSNSEGSSKTTVNEYWPADTNNWILGRLKKATVTSVKP